MNNSDIVYFAKTNFRSREQVFGIKRVDRRQHMYVIGQTGTGKSTFLKNVALQDIKSGRGVCIVDPHGEFVEEVLTMIPEKRTNDVIYFNPADSEYPIGFNVLEVPDVNNPEYKPIAASSLMGIFTKIWANVWSARMEYILNNAILALLDNPGSTLLGVQRILVDKEYRKQILSNVKDPVVRAFWLQEYEQYDPRFRNEAIAPIQNKVGQFLSSSIVRNIVGQPHSTLNLYNAMNEEKIVLVNVSKGRIGEDNSQLLGAMVITKIQLAAMERVRIPEAERNDFYLFVDEFQNFATDSFASILSEARKYRLNLVLAHQYIGQLVTDTSTKVRDAVFGNVGTVVCFRIGAADAEFLENEFAPEVTIEDLVGLPNHRVFLKLMIDQVRSRPFSATTLPPLAIEVAKEGVERIVEASRKRYSQKRADIEEEINQWSGFMGQNDVQKPRFVPSENFNRPMRTAAPLQPPQRYQRQESVLQAPRNAHFEQKQNYNRSPVSAPQPAPLPSRTLSLSVLRSKQAEEPKEHASTERPRQHQNQAEKLSELRSVLQGVIGKRNERKKEESKPISAQKQAEHMPIPKKMEQISIPKQTGYILTPNQTEQKTGSLKPGEAIKL